ncbi:MAG: hypothetical protein K0S65_5873 [Labilithrix sp.]|nr:hypothetical protein [Labilithrix sp.]
MRIGSKALSATCAFALTIFLAAACADSDEERVAPAPDASTSLPPADDAGESPSHQDASDGAPLDAAPRTCSDDNFCHTDAPPKQTMQAVWADGAGTAWAGTKEGAILRWDGKRWAVHATGLGEIRALWGSGPTEIWAVGARGIHRGHGDTSATVAFAPSILPEAGKVLVTSLWGSGPSDVWAVGQRTDGVQPAGRVYHYTGPSADEATSPWSIDALSDEMGTSYDRVWGSPGSGVWISATVLPLQPWDDPIQRVLRRAPATTSFAEVELPPYEHEYLPDAFPSLIFGAAASSDTDVWLVVRTDWFQDGYYHGTSQDNGATFTWSIIPYDRIDELGYTAIAGSSSGVWAVGKYGRVETWDGKAFTQASLAVNGLPIIDPFYAIWTAADGEVWAVGKGVALHRAKK